MPKESNFKDVIAKFKAKEQQQALDIRPEALNKVWNQFHFGTMYALWAEAGGGKTTLTLQAVRSLLKAGKTGLFIDVEKAFNEQQQETFKLTEFISSGQLVTVTVSNYKDLEEIVLSLPGSGIDFVVIDSITAVRPYTKEGIRVEDVRPGITSQQQNAVINQLKDIAYDNNIGVIIIAHARANIQMTGFVNRYAPTTKMAGGYSMYHIPDVITEITTHSKVKDDEGSVIGVEITIQATKNKWTAPYNPIREKLFFGKGISARLSVIEKAIELGIISKEGRSLTVPGDDKKYNRKTIYDIPDNLVKMLNETIKQQTNE